MRLGRQTPTSSLILPYKTTKYKEAEFLYNKSKNTLREWQSLQIKDIMAVNEQGLWVHSKYGYQVSRRNGKGEVLIAREIWGLVNGEKILHTAHQTATSRSAWERLGVALSDIGIPYKSTKMYGCETIRIEETGGRIQFRTRTSKSGLGEGYDLLVIDEAQEYTIDQESALKYTVSASENPQTILCGTPPTATSSGTVFEKMRNATLQGQGVNCGWAEWSVDSMKEPTDKDAWYQTNPSLGQGLTERAIEDEITSDKIDFNIQRLGFWLKYNQKSSVSTREWENLKIDVEPKFKGKLYIGIKFSMVDTVSLSVAIRTKDDRIYLEGIDCRETKEGLGWLINFVERMDKNSLGGIWIDGVGKPQILSDEYKELRIKHKILKLNDVILANSQFEQALFEKEICHNAQPSMVQIVTNCEKRAIGTRGGFGYKSLKEEYDISLMDSIILAHYGCKNTIEKSSQKVMY